MKSIFKHFRIILLAFILVANCFPAQAQEFNFESRSEPVGLTAAQIKTHGLNDTITVTQSKWSEMMDLGGSWSQYFQFKSIKSFVKFYVNHEYPIKVADPYIYRLSYQLYGYSNINGTNPDIINDTLTIAYKPDSLASFEDIQMKQYNGYYKIMIVLTGLYEISNASAPPVAVNLGTLTKLNFNVEGAIEVQPFDKQVKVGTGYVNVYGIGAPALVPYYNLTATNTARVSWNLSGAAPNAELEILPANYELEWTYVDNYKVALDSVGNPTYTTNPSPTYNFKHNSTRVTIDTNAYEIPLTYQQGILVYRVRMVRPDDVHYRYPIYGKWSLTADSGSMTSVAAASKITIANAHLGDKFNWQYTVSFAEQGKYKHVMSYYDGMLKNRESITRFNSMPNKVLATMQVYDYEGRPSISILPTPITTPNFQYQPNLALNSRTQLPYRASDFDSLQPGLCP